MVELSRDEITRRIRIVVDECDGIQPQFEMCYLHSIAYAAGRANEAFIRYDVELACEAGATTICSTVQEALSHAAALSRFFWPSRRKGLNDARARRLREAFNLDDASPLRNRDLRNALEHFDERLDDYLIFADVGHFFPSPILDDHTLSDEPTARIFKLVDPHNHVFVLLGVKFEYAPIRTECAAVLAKATEFDTRLPRR